MSQPTTEQNQALINLKAFQTGTLLTDTNNDPVAAGSVLFADADKKLQVDGSNLFWDDTNDRLGIGTATPARRLDIADGALAMAEISLPTLSVAATAFLYVADVSGSTAVFARFPSGVSQQLAIEQ